MAPRVTHALALLSLAACTGKDAPAESDLPPIRGDETEAPCLGHDPIAVSLDLSNGGVTDFDGTPYPTLLFTVRGTDEDGNLNYITLGIWYEEGGDGDFTPSGAADISNAMSTGADDCEQTESDFKLKVQVGGGLDYNTAYDFAVQITDASGEVSNVLTGAGVTPKQDGSDGDGT